MDIRTFVALAVWTVNGVVSGALVGFVLGGGRKLVFGMALGVGVSWLTYLWISTRKEETRRAIDAAEEARRWLDDFLVKHQGGSK